MRRILFWACCGFLISGCATVDIPNYIQDKSPYKQTFYAGFDQVVDATSKTLTKYGWTVANKYDPTVFEQNKELKQADAKQIMLSTDVRQTAFFVGTRYARINAYIRTVDSSSTEVEIRYLTETSMPVKTFKNYKNDRSVKNILNDIGLMLK